ncbi:hypothetical protein EJB05_48911, partial [Eragrostis curvula]
MEGLRRERLGAAYDFMRSGARRHAGPVRDAPVSKGGCGRSRMRRPSRVCSGGSARAWPGARSPPRPRQLDVLRPAHRTVLISPHGVQMTNMLFMDRNSSVMEFYPLGCGRERGAGNVCTGGWLTGLGCGTRAHGGTLTASRAPAQMTSSAVTRTDRSGSTRPTSGSAHAESSRQPRSARRAFASRHL